MDAINGGLGTLQTFGPLLGGFGVVIWLGWRLFWKVDRRSQMELALKDKRIKELEDEVADERRKRVEEVTLERTKRFAAENELARAEARETSLETQIQELAAQAGRHAVEIQKLREKVERFEQGNHG